MRRSLWRVCPCTQMLCDWMGGLRVDVPADVPLAPEDAPLYIFADNSNMHIGAQRGAPTNAPGGTPAVPVIHLRYPALLEKVVAEPVPETRDKAEGGTPRFVAKQFVAGVMPEAVASMWRLSGFVVRNGRTVRVCGGVCSAAHEHTHKCECVHTDVRVRVRVRVRVLQDDAGAHIDELLHAQILDTVITKSPAILALLTGDGNHNGGTTLQ
jgi:hypothetical protein